MSTAISALPSAHRPRRPAPCRRVPAHPVAGEHRSLDAGAHHPRQPVLADHRQHAGHADPDAARHRLLDRDLRRDAVRRRPARRPPAASPSARRRTRRRCRCAQDAGQHVADAAALPDRAVVGGDRHGGRQPAGVEVAEQPVRAARAEHHVDAAAALAQGVRERQQRGGAVPAADQRRGDRVLGSRNGLPSGPTTSSLSLRPPSASHAVPLPCTAKTNSTVPP